MGYVSSATLASISALLFGLMLVATGLYARRGGRLRNRQGAEVLAGFWVVVGLAGMIASAVLLAQSLIAVF